MQAGNSGKTIKQKATRIAVRATPSTEIKLKKKTIKIKMVHINDTHSHFESSPLQMQLPVGQQIIKVNAACGGYSLLDSFVGKQRTIAEQENAGFLFLHAGDSFEGSIYFSCFQGLSNAQILNEMRVDAMTVGNHELDTGDELLARFVKLVNFPVLSANMCLADTSNSPLQQCLDKLRIHSDNADQPAYLVKNINGLQIAIFGLSLSDMHDIANPSADVDFIDYISCAQTLVNEINAAGINSIIVLSHLGYAQDCLLAEAVSGISLIVGGHSHTLQGDFSNIGLAKETPYAQQVNNSYVLQAGCNALAAGLVDITFSSSGKIINISGGNKLLLVKDSITTDSSEQRHALPALNRYLSLQENISFETSSERIEKILDEHFRPQIARFKNDIVGHVLTRKRHLRIPDAQGGSQVAPLVANSLLYYAQKHDQHVDFAMINGGAIRSSLEQAPLTAALISGQLLPFRIAVQSAKVTGETLFQTIDSAVKNSALPGGSTGSYPYFSKLSIQLKSTELSEGITKIYQQKADGELFEIDRNKVYSIVTTSYIACGKGGYSPLCANKWDVHDFAITPSDAFTDYLREFKTVN